MGDWYTMLSESLSQQHVLVAIMAEPLIERMLKHHFAANEQVGCVQMLIRRCLSLARDVLVFLGLLVEVAQVLALQTAGNRAQAFFVAVNAHAPADNAQAGTFQVARNELVVEHRHVAIDKQ